MRISDWSSDVCSSDLRQPRRGKGHRDAATHRARPDDGRAGDGPCGSGGEPGRLTLGEEDVPERAGLTTRRERRERVPITRDSLVEGKRHRAFDQGHAGSRRSEEHTSELQSLMRSSYAVFCVKKKKMNKANK